MSEIVAAEKWLYDTLAADSTLVGLVSGIYSGMAPEGVAFPLALFAQHRPLPDLTAVGATRIWASIHYVVRGVAETASYGGDLETIADRIDAVLHAGSGSTAQGTVYECVRVMPFALPEQANGRQFRHLGGIYQVRAI